VVRLLLAHQDVDVNEANASGFTALIDDRVAHRPT
jgi:hypothetical protein